MSLFTKSKSTKPSRGSDTADASAAEQRLQDMAQLLDELAVEGPPRAVTSTAGIVASATPLALRLGMARALFAALRYKHEPTAEHGLRVAMICSVWAFKRDMHEELREDLELAALLHDIGKIGIPDYILEKPGSLSAKETAAVDCHWLLGREILRAACASSGALSIMSHGRTWFDGSRQDIDGAGASAPIAARMMAIVDAFDSMTTDQIYRPAMPRERAIHELFRCSGSQFDPDLVAEFAKLQVREELRVPEELARGWLSELYPETFRDRASRDGRPAGLPNMLLFTRKLMDNMHDGVIFVDVNRRVIHWNRGVERLTGIAGASMCQRQWLPSLLAMRDEQGRSISDAACPVAHALSTGVQWLRRLTICGRSGSQKSVDAHAVPVMASDGAMQGLALLLHDVSPEISLEQRCQSLHEMATRDPLTQVANRAEFDRVHELFVAAHAESRRPCGLIITDIDRFKSVNDTYGHQAGDQVLQNFSRVLRNMASAGDLVARYGGEEFVVLCADCNNAAAVRRAEEIRAAFAAMPQPALDGRAVTASFGVTEVQPGDTPETMLRRADRALFKAKESGRNKVVQLGMGVESEEESAPAGLVNARGPGQREEAIIEQLLVSVAPLECNLEKLRGFVADHHADVVTSDGEHVVLRFGGRGSLFRYGTDRGAALIMDLRLSEHRQEQADGRRGLVTTRIHLVVSLAKKWERRKNDAAERARQLFVSLRSYLMASNLEPESEAHGDRGTDRAKNEGR